MLTLYLFGAWTSYTGRPVTWPISYGRDVVEQILMIRSFDWSSVLFFTTWFTFLQKHSHFQSHKNAVKTKHMDERVRGRGREVHGHPCHQTHWICQSESSMQCLARSKIHFIRKYVRNPYLKNFIMEMSMC